MTSLLPSSAGRWNAQLYDTKHAFVFQYGSDLVSLLGTKPGERILDLGAGTGHLTQKIAELGCEVVGLDSSADMVARARANYPNLRFDQGDAADFQADAPFDAVFSNATLHWIHTPDRVIECVYRALRPGGRFVGEMGGLGNVQRIISALETALAAQGIHDTVRYNYFPSLAEYATKLEAGGFRVTLAAHFDRNTQLDDPETGVTDWISMFRGDAIASLSDEARQQVFEQVKTILKPTNFQDGRWFADYKRLRFVAIK
jgi:trans-aconitate methyltransferase